MRAAYARKNVAVVIDSPVVRVRGWLAHKTAVDAGIRPVYIIDSWVFDETRLADFVAHCERRNIAVEVTGDTNMSGGTVAPPGAPRDTDLPLFGPGGGDAA